MSEAMKIIDDFLVNHAFFNRIELREIKKAVRKLEQKNKWLQEGIVRAMDSCEAFGMGHDNEMNKDFTAIIETLKQTLKADK